ncbi:MAG: peptide chain release factor N(5)-glutamine methyltransferase [Anaerolineae bacterium]|nr:peptide chain release factor N(5)-glutamine methyltransferase [Gloeobacterales cyanobacterium ES-bin-313]
MAGWRQRAIGQAFTANIDIAEVDYLILSVSGLDRLQIRLAQENLLAPWEDALEQLWQKRLRERIPVQYLTGLAYWRDLALKVSPATLIPRPETELLVDLAIDFLTNYPNPVLADLGTGTGALAIAIARALPACTVYAVDLSSEALAIARTNIETYGLEKQIPLLQGAWFSPLPPDLQLDALISNPPYIPTAMVGELAEEVRLHEPHLALDGGSDGLQAIRVLIQEAPRFLKPGGFWGIEVMAGQAGSVISCLEKAGDYEHIGSVKDLAGIARFVIASVSAR